MKYRINTRNKFGGWYAKLDNRIHQSRPVKVHRQPMRTPSRRHLIYGFGRLDMSSYCIFKT